MKIELSLRDIDAAIRTYLKQKPEFKKLVVKKIVMEVDQDWGEITDIRASVELS